MNYKRGVAKVKSCVALVSRQYKSSTTTLVHGFLFQSKSPDNSDISFLSIGADKKISIFFVQILLKII